MPDGKLKFEGREIELTGGIVTCGRSADNAIAFPDDSNVSRYHAEIEERNGEYILIDLGSSNGTLLNGQKVTSEMPLRDGDTILLGGTSQIDIRLGESLEDDEAEGSGSSMGGGSEMGSIPMGGGSGGGTGLLSDLGVGGGSSASSTAASSSAGGAAVATGGAAGIAGGAASSAPAASNPTILVAGVVGGLALVCVVAAGAIYLTRGSGCHARAVVTKPEAGDTITQPVEIEVESKDTECVSEAVFTLDGNEVARTDEQPFTIKLDPKQFPELSDGFDHNLQIVLIDDKGQTIPQPELVPLAFETREVNKPEPTPEIVQGNTQQPTGKKGTAVSLLDIKDMSTRLVKQYPTSAGYNVSNQQFLAAIQKATADYAKEGYFLRAAPYRDAINVAYVQEQNLDAGLGFMLAMSRSNFNPVKQGVNEGLWQMSGDFATTNGYTGQCGAETLSDPKQNCAAKASALYMKAIVFGVFDGDVIYSAAAFGKSPADAGVWKASLPANRSDIWNSIKTPPERDQLVRFFAAGIVGENPQKFGLSKDRPLSELYRVTQ